ncbi:MAG: radical SAM family heme chaperone HemW [Elusimicrobiaceae bacterium]|nr:radical SAM family heme chaperone HemW [Elusimicrobiaceae bacterium]
MSGLYIHIPFCRQKCRYCDFASFACQESLTDSYLCALDTEASFYSNQKFETLYIGGGTPSILSANQLDVLCEIITRRFAPISSFAESTVEANPESLTTEKLKLLKQLGINRLSLGLQSMNDDVLKRIGRLHDVNTFLSAYDHAREAGFENISIDLIAGLPNQDEKDFLEGLQKVLALGPQHLSVYGLQVEEGTPFYREGIQTDDDLVRRELEKTHFLLQEAGFVHYEISNFALSGYESKHNLAYWKNEEYLGLGSAAASLQKGERRSNTTDLTEYLRRMRFGLSAVEFSEKLTGKAKEGEEIMLGLRMLGGVCLSPQKKTLFSSEIDSLCRSGLVTLEGDLLKLTFEGMFLANQAFMAFVGPFDA